MPKIKYLHLPILKNQTQLAVVGHANDIIAEYQAQGFVLTLRQLYYQFVSRDLIPNNMREYKKLGGIINDARLAGLIDWSALEDRTRNLQQLSHWNSPTEIIDACAGQYRIDKWADQPVHVEVWIEKDALVGVIEGVCNELDVPYFSCRGYTSQSEMWSAGRRLRHFERAIILHLGDHDPSGIDMTRDIRTRLEMFSGDNVEVKRIALNDDQIQTYNPPPNPAKTTDSRAADYIARYGQESWELDALEPRTIAALIRDEIEAVRDDGEWALAESKEAAARDQLKAIAEHYDAVIDSLDLP